MNPAKAVLIDLRSDTVTKPTDEMRQAMANAEVGDDVYEEDPTINKLQEMSARFLGKEAAIFVPSGTMGNLTVMMSHCWGRGYEVFVGDQSHIYMYEQGGAAQLAGIQLRGLRTNLDGTFDLEQLKSKMRLKPNPHECINGLICLENTHNRCGGVVLPQTFVDEVCQIAKEHGLPVHMDGARIVNASVYLKKPVASLVKDCDSVSMCLSKGLGAPAGTIVAGSKELIAKVLRCRKVLGGGMRQVGILAAAGIVALKSAEQRLQLDHDRAQWFAKAINALNSPLVSVNLSLVHTNIVLLDLTCPHLTPQQFVAKMAEVCEEDEKVLGQRVSVKTYIWSSVQSRCVLHSDISKEHISMAFAKVQWIVRNCESQLKAKENNS